MATQWTAGTTSGQVLTAATLNTIGAAWESFTVGWKAATTNPAIGNGTIAGKYTRFQKLVICQITIIPGSTTTFGSGQYLIDLPITAKATLSQYSNTGFGYLIDSSAARCEIATTAVYNSSTTQIGMKYGPNTGAFGDVSSTVPFTWAVGDQIHLTFVYEAA
jgi:hypothetical protein